MNSLNWFLTGCLAFALAVGATAETTAATKPAEVKVTVNADPYPGFMLKLSRHFAQFDPFIGNGGCPGNIACARVEQVDKAFIFAIYAETGKVAGSPALQGQVHMCRTFPRIVA